jgi:hypothetical protein
VMASPTLNLGAFSPTELQSLLVAAKAEYLRALGGRMQQGSSAAQSYGLLVMSTDELIRLINSITSALGLDSGPFLVQPNFNSRGFRHGAWGDCL